MSTPASASTNIYIEDTQGNPVYNFDTIDAIYDVYVENNFIPIIEFGFMPYDLVSNASAKATYLLDGWKYPPKDYTKWKNLIIAFLTHLSQRYGQQVENWMFEVWNEPNINNYWLSTVDEYCKLFDYSVEAVKTVNPNFKVGGPALATTASSSTFLDQFLRHITTGTNYATGQIGTKIDFISFHTKGAGYSPQRSYGHPVSLQYPSVGKIVSDITENINIVAKYTQLNNVPVIVDECDPAVGTIYGVYDNPNFIVCNTEYYPAIVAAMILNILKISPRIERITHWSFYMEGKRMFEGNRSLVTNYNLYLPILNGLKLLEKLQTKQYSIEISNNPIPLNGFVTFADDNLSIQLLVFSHVDDYTVNENQTATIQFNHISYKYVLVKHYKIDIKNNNIYFEWVKMGKPDFLTDEQLEYFKSYQQLKLFSDPALYQIENDQLILESISINTHSVDFFEIISLD